MTPPDVSDFALAWVAKNIGPGPYPFLECDDPLIERTIEGLISDAKEAGIRFAKLDVAVAGVRGFIEDAFDAVTDPRSVPRI